MGFIHELVILIHLTLQSYKGHISEDVRPNKKASLDDLNKELLEE